MATELKCVSLKQVIRERYANARCGLALARKAIKAVARLVLKAHQTRILIRNISSETIGLEMKSAESKSYSVKGFITMGFASHLSGAFST